MKNTLKLLLITALTLNIFAQGRGAAAAAAPRPTSSKNPDSHIYVGAGYSFFSDATLIGNGGAAFNYATDIKGFNFVPVKFGYAFIFDFKHSIGVEVDALFNTHINKLFSHNITNVTHFAVSIPYKFIIDTASITDYAIGASVGYGMGFYEYNDTSRNIKRNLVSEALSVGVIGEVIFNKLVSLGTQVVYTRVLTGFNTFSTDTISRAEMTLTANHGLSLIGTIGFFF